MVNFSSTDTFFQFRLLFGQRLVKFLEAFKSSLKCSNVRFWIESCSWNGISSRNTGAICNPPLFVVPERRLIALLVSVRPSMKSLTMKSLLCEVVSIFRYLPNTAWIRLTENVDNENVAGFG